MNAIGFRTLFAKETRRFLRVPGQTLAQPIVTTALYFLVFGYALGGRVREVDLLLAFTLAAILRGMMVGGIVWVISALFTGFSVGHPLWVLVFGLLVGATFGLVGLAVAIWSDKFEQLNIVPTFIITPLTFLGGVFYSANMLPPPWSYVSRVNPVLYMVEGLRYGVVGTSSSSPWLGLAVTGGIGLLSLAIAAWMLATGYKLRS